MQDSTPRRCATMQFVLHELLNVEAETQANAQTHADLDAETINQVLEEAGKFA